MRRLVKRVAMAGLFLAALIVTDEVWTSAAEAIRGRPATPGSVAGVARRTTRRVIRRTTIYVATLPSHGCHTVIIEGTTLTQCGSTYYQPYGTQYVIVNVD